MIRTMVLGDVHGNVKALKQCFERSGFNKTTETIIVLGDVVDGYPDVKECVEEILTCKNLIYVLGNHCKWFYDWAREPREFMWTTQGGENTFHSYVPKSHINLFRDAYAAYTDDKNRCFVHGGFDIKEPNFDKQKIDTLIWDRHLLEVAYMNRKQHPDIKYGGFEEVFVGHTATSIICGDDKPHKWCNVWALDTGAGFRGKLTLMDVDTHEYFQSDSAKELYPNDHGR
jgi:serine/threonine protein phosphatase 1